MSSCHSACLFPNHYPIASIDSRNFCSRYDEQMVVHDWRRSKDVKGRKLKPVSTKGKQTTLSASNIVEGKLNKEETAT